MNANNTINNTTSNGRVAPASPAAAVVARAEAEAASDRKWRSAMVKLGNEALFASEAEALEDWVRARGRARVARARVAAGEVRFDLLITAIWTEEGFAPPSVVGPMSMDWDREEASRLRREAGRLLADRGALAERVAREGWANRELVEQYRGLAEPVI